MSRKDDLTGKKALVGNYRSHAMNATKRKFNLNLKTVTLLENGKKVTYKVSVKTARTLRKQGRI
ncbi:MAG: 50S ribosomal protein L28 [Mycoplasmataceae bacterium]|nr:50S ribosomal protein L28 [Mycoplasmataceae bacterium]MBR2055619.1 50S ribosomal protein L28 [Mycoplasmataceae bacterium]MBR2998996.1 50S ribosomal protein L28 [Mycoplasmataceae bacterium]MBR3571089.1 50S ribosomal protein L28 [Mycoplasmataceae bacterium]